MTRTQRLDVATRVGYEVSAVTDDDGIVGEARQQLAVDPGGMDGIGIAREVIGVRGNGGEGPRPQAARPFLDGQGITDVAGEAEEEGGEVPGGTRGEFAMGGDLSSRVGDVDDRRRWITEAAVAEAEVQ